MTEPQPTVHTQASITHTYTWEPSDDRTIVRSGELVAVTCLWISRDGEGYVSTSWDGVPRLSSGEWGRARRTGGFWFGQVPEWAHPLIDAVPTPIVTWEGQA